MMPDVAGIHHFTYGWLTPVLAVTAMHYAGMSVLRLRPLSDPAAEERHWQEHVRRFTEPVG